MKTKETKTIVKLLSRSSCFAFLSLVLTLQVVSQDKSNQRGFSPGNSYAIGDIESINMTNGNLMINFPLGQLPAGRGGLTAGLSLTYNSKLYDQKTVYKSNEQQICQSPSGCYYQEQVLDGSNEGGWKFSSGYSFVVENRLDQFVDVPSSRQPSCMDAEGIQLNTYIYKLSVVFPDGGRHLMIPSGHLDWHDHDGFFDVTPDGWVRTAAVGRERVDR